MSEPAMVVPNSDDWRQILAQPMMLTDAPNNNKIPTTISEISANFIEAVLRRFYGETLPKVIDITVERSPQQGLMSEVGFLTIRYEKEEGDRTSAEERYHYPTELVAKGGISGMEEHLAMGFANERIFYCEVPDEAWGCRPTCYFCEGTLLLLQKLEGAPLDVFRPMPSAVRKTLLSRLAALHARTWIKDGPLSDPATASSRVPFAKEFKSRGVLKPLLPLFVNGVIGDLSKVWTAFKCENDNDRSGSKSSAGDSTDAGKSYASVVSASFERVSKVDFASKLTNMFEKMWYPEDCPDCLCLGDVKQDNMFSAAKDGSDLTLIDFQGAGWGPGINDVVYVLLLGSPPEELKNIWESQVTEYHDHLCKELKHHHHGKEVSTDYDYSLETCKRHFKGAVCGQLISCAVLAKKVSASFSSPKNDSGQPGAANSVEEGNLDRNKQREKQLSEMWCVRWAHAMNVLGVVEDVESLPKDEVPVLI